MTPTTIAARLEQIRKRMRRVAQGCGRDPSSVALIAVSKTFPAEDVIAAMEAGQRAFGENRLQDALPKVDALAGREPPPIWHFIGHLQRNKATSVVGRFALIHSVDSVRLMEALEKQAHARDVIQPILLQLNVSGEESKFGAPPEALGELLRALEASPHLRGEGLMTIPPWSDDPEAARPHFRRLRGLIEGIETQGNFRPLHLSMGMTHDLEVAIEEGATLVRVGTGIFGDRSSLGVAGEPGDQ